MGMLEVTYEQKTDDKGAERLALKLSVTIKGSDTVCTKKLKFNENKFVTITMGGVDLV
jgi:hypothetical protein